MQPGYRAVSVERSHCSVEVRRGDGRNDVPQEPPRNTAAFGSRIGVAMAISD